MELIIILGLLFILLLIMTAPRFSKRKQLHSFDAYVYAHRGLHNEQFCENSLAAFENAKNHGYGMELDVQLTKDNVAVVLHDFSLLRACGIDKQVDECTYEEIRQLKLFHTDATIPLFEDVLKLIDGKVPLIVEIKQKSMNCAVCVQTWKHLRHYQGAYVVESFNPAAMNWFRINHPEIIRGQLSCTYRYDQKMNKVLKFILKNLLGNFFSRPDFIAYDVYERKVFMNQLHRYFFHTPQVFWTVKEKETYEQVKNEGIVIFENFLI